jgi:RNA polymerase sigma factor (sigma-70 family)
MSNATPELLKRCAVGDVKALLELYHALAPALLGMTRRYYANNEDRRAMVNEAMLKVFESLKKQIPQGDIGAYAGRILKNTIIDDYRKNRNHRERIITDATPSPAVEWTMAEYNHFERQVDADMAESMLHRLPDTTRIVFNLFAIEGYTHAEIAAQLGLSEGTSKWHVNKARELLKGILNAPGT